MLDFEFSKAIPELHRSGGAVLVIIFAGSCSEEGLERLDWDCVVVVRSRARFLFSGLLGMASYLIPASQARPGICLHLLIEESLAFLHLQRTTSVWVVKMV